MQNSGAIRAARMRRRILLRDALLILVDEQNKSPVRRGGAPGIEDARQRAAGPATRVRDTLSRTLTLTPGTYSPLAKAVSAGQKS